MDLSMKTQEMLETKLVADVEELLFVDLAPAGVVRPRSPLPGTRPDLRCYFTFSPASTL